MKTIIDIRPYQVMCLICRLGRRDDSKYYFESELDELQRAIKADLNQPLRLRCNVESTFAFQNPGQGLDTPEGDLFNLRRDLSILQRLGLTPGGVYPALDLIRLFVNDIKECSYVCGAPPHAAEQWRGCKFADSGNYERGLEDAVHKLTSSRSTAELHACKIKTAAEIYGHEILEIRPHHLLCMICFMNGKEFEELEPVEADHLYEALDICRKNPDIPLRLVAGPCMICAPCHGYDPESKTCSASFGMGLRDQKKDLDTLRLLGLEYGDILPAAKLYALIFDKIEDLTAICGFATGCKTGPAWPVCCIVKDSDACNKFQKAKISGLHISNKTS